MTLAQQIQTLQSRGLIIADTNKAEQALDAISYFQLAGESDLAAQPLCPSCQSVESCIPSETCNATSDAQQVDYEFHIQFVFTDIKGIVRYMRFRRSVLNDLP